MKRLLPLLTLIVLAFSESLFSQQKRHEISLEEAQKVVDNLKWQVGSIPLGGDLVTLNLAPGYRFLNAGDTNTVMNQLFQNPPSSRWGMIFPPNADPMNMTWAAIVRGFEEEGYVKDEDADKIDADKLLKDIQEGQKEANEERVKDGYPALEILGWAMKPKYDKEAKKLTWAIELRVVGSSKSAVNYYVRILGRRGFLVLNVLGGADALTEIDNSLPQVLSMVNFNEGHRYSDFNPKTDKVAAYGIAGLIAAGIGIKLLKAGVLAAFFKPILGVLIAAKKLVIVAVVAIGAFFKKLFGRKNSESA